MSNVARQRLDYIDATKGVAILCITFLPFEKGVIPAKKYRNGKNHIVWDIPDNTPCPPHKKNSESGIPNEKTQLRVLRQKGKQGYVASFAGAMSIRSMSQFLQTTPAEVRAIYDEIVAKGGGM